MLNAGNVFIAKWQVKVRERERGIEEKREGEREGESGSSFALCVIRGSAFIEHS